MQEDYGKQLKAAEAGRLQSLEELKQVYEAQLQEKSQQLTEVDQETVKVFASVPELEPCVTWFLSSLCVQCREESQRHSRWFRQVVKAVEQEEQRKIHMIGTEFENKLQAEKETSRNLKGEVGVITQNVS